MKTMLQLMIQASKQSTSVDPKFVEAFWQKRFQEASAEDRRLLKQEIPPELEAETLDIFSALAQTAKEYFDKINESQQN